MKRFLASANHGRNPSGELCTPDNAQPVSRTGGDRQSGKWDSSRLAERRLMVAVGLNLGLGFPTIRPRRRITVAVFR